MKDDTNQPIVVVSDIHLGTSHMKEGLTDSNRNQFKDFLREFPQKLGSKLDSEPKHLVLNGDIDDLWRRSVRTLTRENYDIYALLEELRKEVRVHYILGNHDWYAKRDREGEDPQKYYDTNYCGTGYITTHDTTYKFRHGYEFDKGMRGAVRTLGYKSVEKSFDFLAQIDGDVYGNAKEVVWNTIKGRSEYNLNRTAENYLDFDILFNQIDIENRKQDRRVAPKGAMNSIRDDTKADWLCIGHTHQEGVKSDATGSKGGVANSGTWKGGENTFLVLERTPSIWSWNDGDPTRLS